MATSSVTVAPAFFKITVKPGDKLQLRSLVTNSTNADATFKVRFTNISIYDLLKRDSSAFTENSDPIYPGSWLSDNSDTLTVPANSTKEFDFAMDVPTYAKFDNYYPVVLFQQITGDEASELGINSDISTVIYMNMGDVEGASTSRGGIEIKDFEVKNPFVIFPSADISIDVKNNSSDYVYPVGDITIYDNNQQRQDDILRIDNDYKSLLPGDDYTETFSWYPGVELSLIPKFGQYKLVAEVKDDVNHVLVTKEITFTVVPIFHIAVLIAIIAGTIYLLRKKIRKLLRKLRKTHK